MEFHNSIKILLGMTLLACNFLDGESAPHSSYIDPPAWNFLLKKRDPITIRPPRVETEDSLRIPPVDFLLKSSRIPAQEKYSKPRWQPEDDEMQHNHRPHHKNKSWNESIRSTLKIPKRAIVNYFHAVKKMFTNDNGAEHEGEDDQNYKTRFVQERGDYRPKNAAMKPLPLLPSGKIPRTKYGTKLELNESNRVKAVAMIMPKDEGDPFTETSYLKNENSEDSEGLGIGEAISDLFWGSVYNGN